MQAADDLAVTDPGMAAELAAKALDLAPGVADVLEPLARWSRRVMPDTKWNSVALSTLANVVENGPRRVTDLAAAERITQPGMTGLVDRLVAAGLVSRGSDPEDGRATLVSATAEGRAYLADIRRARAGIIDRYIANLPSAYRTSLASAAAALAALASASLAPGESPLIRADKAV